VGEKVTLATQNALIEAREKYKDVHSRLIGASVRNGEQVAFLAGLDVLTIPPKAIKEFQESGKSADQVVSHLAEDILPGIDASHALAKRFPSLWEMPETFISFVDALMAENGLDEMSANELVEFCRKHNMNLFHAFSDDEFKNIYDHGKIPCLDNWSESIALDDLMTQSALQSFTKDQNALDDRIRSFLK
jgi:transaldolase